MSDEPKPLTGKKLIVEGTTYALREASDVPVVTCEVVVEAMLLNNDQMVLSLGHYVQDFGSDPEVRVGVRLRISPNVVAYLEGQIARWRSERAAVAAEIKKTAN